MDNTLRFIKNGPHFLSFIIHSNDNQMTWFLPVLAKEILTQNISTKYGSQWNILRQSRRKADVIMCRDYKLPCLNWCVRHASLLGGDILARGKGPCPKKAPHYSSGRCNERQIDRSIDLTNFHRLIRQIIVTTWTQLKSLINVGKS